jgi:hypothetical protein
VADEHDRHAVGRESTEGREQRVDLLRDQDGRRLVEDEDPAIARERLEDLDALLLADREGVHARVGTDANAEAIGGHLRGPHGGIQVERDARSPAEGQVLGHGHRPDEREVLRDHADARRDGVLRRADDELTPVDQDGPRVRVGQPVQDAHQRRLAGAVLAQQGVDLAALDGEVDRVVRDERPEVLGDPAQLDRGRRRHRGQLSRRGHLSRCSVGLDQPSGMTEPGGADSVMSTRNVPSLMAASFSIT